MSKKDKRISYLFSSNAPEPKGHYSQSVAFNDLLFISGQLPVNPFTGELIKGDIEDQTKQTLENITVILKDAGSDINKLLKISIYISDISLWPLVNQVYSKFMGKAKPARAVVPVGKLPLGSLIEIEAIAAL